MRRAVSPQRRATLTPAHCPTLPGAGCPAYRHPERAVARLCIAREPDRRLSHQHGRIAPSRLEIGNPRGILCRDSLRWAGMTAEIGKDREKIGKAAKHVAISRASISDRVFQL